MSVFQGEIFHVYSKILCVTEFRKTFNSCLELEVWERTNIENEKEMIIQLWLNLKSWKIMEWNVSETKKLKVKKEPPTILLFYCICLLVLFDSFMIDTSNVSKKTKRFKTFLLKNIFCLSSTTLESFNLRTILSFAISSLVNLHLTLFNYHLFKWHWSWWPFKCITVDPSELILLSLLPYPNNDHLHVLK